MIKKIFLTLFLFNMPVIAMEALGAAGYSYKNPAPKYEHSDKETLRAAKYPNWKLVLEDENSDDDVSYDEYDKEEPLFTKVIEKEKEKIGLPITIDHRMVMKTLLHQENNEKNHSDFETWKKEDIKRHIYDKKTIETMVDAFFKRRKREQDVEKAKDIATDYWSKLKKNRNNAAIEIGESIEDLKCLVRSLKAQQEIVKQSLNKREYYCDQELNNLIWTQCILKNLLRCKSEKNNKH